MPELRMPPADVLAQPSHRVTEIKMPHSPTLPIPGKTDTRSLIPIIGRQPEECENSLPASPPPANSAAHSKLHTGKLTPQLTDHPRHSSAPIAQIRTIGKTITTNSKSKGFPRGITRMIIRYPYV